MPHILTEQEFELSQKRNQYYNGVTNASIRYGINCSPQAGNHMIFRMGGYHGYVNWYFLQNKIDKYGGNVCVTFRNCQLPNCNTSFHAHYKHDGRIQCSAEINDVSEAVEWTMHRIIEIVNQ